MHDNDLYRVLGVDTDANRAQIVHAYRRQAQLLHPDTRPADPDAAHRFVQVTAAYDVLGHPARRAAYDRERAEHQQPPTEPNSPTDSPPLWAGPVRIDLPGSTGTSHRTWRGNDEPFVPGLNLLARWLASWRES